MSEQDTPRNRLIIALVVGVVSSLIAIVLIVAQYFGMTVREEVFKKELSVKPIARRELEQKEDHLLGSYRWTSQKEGKVRVPVERARELVLKEWSSRPTGLAPSADLTTPPPAPPKAPAAAPGAAPAAAPATATPPGGATPPSATPAGGPGPAPTSPPAATPPPAPAPGQAPGASPPPPTPSK